MIADPGNLKEPKRKDLEDTNFAPYEFYRGMDCLEKMKEMRTRGAHLGMTAREALDKLDDIGIVKNQIGPRVILCPLQADAEHRKILNALGIKSIPRVLLS